MKTNQPALLLALLASSIFNVSSTFAQAEQAVADQIELHWAALNSGDIAAFNAAFTEKGYSAASSDGSFWEYERQTLEEAMADTKGVKFQLHPHHVTVTMLTKDIALATYYLVGSITPADGEAISNYRTRASQVWVKVGDTWKIQHEHFSALFGGQGVGG